MPEVLIAYTLTGTLGAYETRNLILAQTEVEKLNSK